MGLLDMLQNDPEKREALRQGLLAAGAQMMAGGRQDLGTSIGQGLGSGVNTYASQREVYKQEAEKARQRQAQQSAINAAMMPGRPAMPQKFNVGGNPYATRDAAQAAARPNHNTQLMAGAMGSQAQPEAIEEVPGQTAQPGGFDAERYYTEVLMNPDNPERDTALRYFASKKDPAAEAKTAEVRNWEFAQSLPEDQRAQFMAKSSGGAGPSSVQEWEFFNQLPAQDQARFLEMKRNPQIMNLGGSQAVRAPGGGIGESYAVTPKPTDMPAFQAEQETAKITARETAQRGAEATSNLPKVRASAANARNMVQGVLDHPGFSSTVGVTALPGARFIPGTKEADFQSRMDQLKGSAFLQAFETLKGGGQITEVEGKKATDAINRMSISTSEKEFRAAAGDFLSVVDRAEQNAAGAAKPSRPTTGKRGGVLSQGEILNVELKDAIDRGDAQNERLIREEMRRMGVKGDAPAKTKPIATFDLPPNAKQYEGKTLRDTKSGKRFKAVGGKWQEVK